ncbi:MAG: UbiA family prenyltransferase [Chlamydiae bacterium]|nr:UbiA family prenyltransferase [Chlamydiota bacterium]
MYSDTPHKEAKRATKQIGLFHQTTHYLRMIRFSHSLFALPFAISAVVLVHPYYPVTLSKILWILLAMISARSAAMAFNRITDADIDLKNPRTQEREIPKGIISKKNASFFSMLSSFIFIFSAFQLNQACGILSFPVLMLFLIYPHTKRFTWLSHFFLGLSLGISPLGVWLAISNGLQGPIILLSLGIIFWVAGFDILYACQDIQFDRDHHLFSIPQRFGLQKALRIAILLHGLSLGLLMWTGISFKLNFFYFIGCSVIGFVILYEHSLVKPQDLSKAQRAFQMNGYIGILYLLAIWIGTR